MLVLSVLEHIRALKFVSLGMFRVLLIILLFFGSDISVAVVVALRKELK